MCLNRKTTEWALESSDSKAPTVNRQKGKAANKRNGKVANRQKGKQAKRQKVPINSRQKERTKHTVGSVAEQVGLREAVAAAAGTLAPIIIRGCRL